MCIRDRYDLPDALALARRFLAATLPAERAEAAAPRDVADEAGADGAALDLFVSNFALSELPRALQEPYIERVAARAARGYVTWNHGIRADAMNAKEFADAIRARRGAATAVKIVDECPRTAPENVIVTWEPA